METPALTFAEPAWFLVLAVLPFFVAIYWWSMRRSKALISRIVAPRLREQLAGSVSFQRRAFKAAFMVAALLFLIVALARPQMGFIQQQFTARGRDVILALDTSKSMLATDVSPSRLARAKLVAQDLLRLLKGDRVGLVAFAGSAFLQAPLTLDESAVLASLDELDTSVIPKGGTNIGEAIRMSEQAFGKAEGKSRALVILTDGEELDADGIAAAKAAFERGIRIFTIGIGSGEGSLIPLRAEGGGADFVRDASGKPVQSKLDENRLREIAEAGGGFYQPLNADAAKTIFEKGILPIEKSDSGIQSSRQPIEQYQWPLGVAIALLIAWMVIGDRRRRPQPARRMPAPVAAAFILIAFMIPAFAEDGMKEYQQKNYQEALSTFEKKLEQSPDSHERQFDVGTAAYQTGDYGKAVDLFTKAMLSEDKFLQENASYNLANSLVRRGEAAREKDSETTKSDWKNAIQHYDEVVKLNSANKNAKENREVVKKMLEQLEKEEQQQKQQDQNKDQQQKQDKDDQKKDQQNQDQQQKDQQKKDQQKKDEQKKDDQQNQQKNQQQQDGQDQKQQQGESGKDEKKDEQQKGQDQQSKGDKKDDEKNKDGEKGDKNEDQQQQEKGDEDGPQEMAKNNSDKGDKPAPTPAPTPGEKKSGDLKSSDKQQEQPQQQENQQAQAAQEGEEREGEMSAAQARGLLNSLRGDEERVRLMLKADEDQVTRDW